VAEGIVRIRGDYPGYDAVKVDVLVVGQQEAPVTLALTAPTSRPDRVPIIDDEPATTPAWAPNNAKTWIGATLLAGSVASLVAGSVWLTIDGRGACGAHSGSTCQSLYDTKPEGWAGVGAGVAAGVAGAILFWQGVHSETKIGIAFDRLTIERHF
jgi:hypothetical protein